MAIASLVGALFAWHLTSIYPGNFDTLLIFNA